MGYRVGILGGGQLARMMVLAAKPLGVEVSCYEPSPSLCTTGLCEVIQGDYQEVDKITAWASKQNIITYENENIPLELAKLLEDKHTLNPGAKALYYCQDRLYEKQLCQDLSIPTAQFVTIDNQEDLSRAEEILGYPFVVKTRRLGYDGKGQFLIKSPNDLLSLSQQLPEVPLIAEKFIQYSHEVSIISATNSKETVFYPLAKNYHEKGILKTSTAPLFDDDLTLQAQTIAKHFIETLNYVGTLAIEFFVVDGKLFVNELAPRVHNSGHWSIDGAVTSQFENHIRAILNMPLGSTEAVSNTVMINCLGKMPPSDQVLVYSNAKLHDYQKSPRPGRKLGHINLIEASETPLTSCASALLKVVDNPTI